MSLRMWERENYRVEEIEFDYDLHEFKVISDNNEEVIATITPQTMEMMHEIIEALDAGECVDGWEDGMGNTIRIKK